MDDSSGFGSRGEARETVEPYSPDSDISMKSVNGGNGLVTRLMRQTPAPGRRTNVAHKTNLGNRYILDSRGRILLTYNVSI